MIVSELTATLGVERDKKSFDKARNDLGQFVKQADTRLQALGKSLGRLGRKNVGSMSSLTGALGLGGMTGKLAPVAVGAGMVIAARDALKFDEALTRLDISSRGAMGSMDAVRSRILDVSRATGMSKEELVAGAASFVALTGDGKTASESLDGFANAARASGSPIEDIVASAASLSQQLKIGSKDFERAFSILIAGGKEGKIELKDLASLLPSLAAQYKKFGGSQGLGGVATLGSAFQIVAQNFGSASEAATGLESLMGSLVQNAKQLKKEQGIDIFEEDGKTLRSIEAITADIASKDLNATKVLGLLHRKEAVNTFNALRDNRKEWERIRGATINANDVAEDGAKFQASSAAQVAKLWNDVKVAVAEAFNPHVVAAFTAMLRDAVETAAHLGGWLQHITGGGGTVETMDQDTQLDKLLIGKGTIQKPERTLAEVETLLAEGQSGRMLALNELGGMHGGGVEGLSQADAALKRRKRGEAITAQQDALRRTQNYMESPNLIGDPEAPTFSMLTPEVPYAPGETTRPGAGTSVSVVAPITINAAGGSPVEIERKLDGWWDSKVRQLMGAVGGE